MAARCQARSPSTCGTGRAQWHLSLQEALARAGIDTFVPNLLGYGGPRASPGRSVQREPPGVRMRRDAASSYPGCDRTNEPQIFPLDTCKGRATAPSLAMNPLSGRRCAHTRGRPLRTHRSVGARHPPGDRRSHRAGPTDRPEGDPRRLLLRRAARGPRARPDQEPRHRCQGQPGCVDRPAFYASGGGTQPAEETRLSPRSRCRVRLASAGAAGTAQPTVETACSGHIGFPAARKRPGSRDRDGLHRQRMGRDRPVDPAASPVRPPSGYGFNPASPGGSPCRRWWSRGSRLRGCRRPRSGHPPVRCSTRCRRRSRTRCWST